MSQLKFRPLEFLCLFAFILVFILPCKFPNVLALNNPSAAIEILSVVATSLAAILAIVIAVVLFVFEIKWRRFENLAYNQIFQHSETEELLALYVLGVVVSLVALFGIESSQLTVQNIKQTYLCFGYFIVMIILLFPFTRNLMYSTQTKQDIIRLVNAIDEKALDLFAPRPIIHNPSDGVTDAEENPLYNLGEIGVRCLKEGNKIIPLFIIEKVTNKLLETLNQEFATRDKRHILGAYRLVFRKIAYQGITEKQEGILATIINAMNDVHELSARNKFPWHFLIEFNETLEDIITQCMKANLEDSTTRGLWRLPSILQAHLKFNAPEEEDLHLLHWQYDKTREYDTDKQSQWQHIYSTYPGIIANITEEAIAQSQWSIASTGMSAISHAVQEAMSLQTLGKIQKFYIVRDSFGRLRRLIQKYAQQRKNEQYTLYSPFNWVGVDRELKSKTPHGKVMLAYMINSMVDLSKENVLTSFWDYNDVGTIGRTLAGCLAKDWADYYETNLRTILDGFDKAREIAQESNNREAYLSVYSQVCSFEDYLKNDTPKIQELKAKLDEYKVKFDKVEEYKKEVEKYADIGWNLQKEDFLGS